MHYQFMCSHIIPGLPPMTTQALHTERINLSPFTKDFRVWGASIETQLISLTVTLWVTSRSTTKSQPCLQVHIDNGPFRSRITKCLASYDKNIHKCPIRVVLLDNFCVTCNPHSWGTSVRRTPRMKGSIVYFAS